MRNKQLNLASTLWIEPWIARHVARLCLCCLMTVLAAGLASAQLTKVHASSPVMANPEIVNLYWDDNWDANHPTLSRSSIDGFTSALVSTPYFAGAGQYGVTGASFRGSFTPVHRPQPPIGPDSGWYCGPRRAPNSINVGTLVDWISCEITHNHTGVPKPPGDYNRNMLYVVYLPSNTSIRDVGQFDSCDGTPNAFNAFHSATLPSQYMFAAVLLSCNTNLAALTVTATHEIIESLTDPTALEWVASGASPVTVGPITIPANGEAADVCTPLPAPILSGGISFFGIQVEAYFSNSAAAAAGSTAKLAACVVGNTPVGIFTAPLVISPASANLLENTTTQFTVTPAATPVNWATTSLTSPTVSVGSDGVLHAGSTVGDLNFGISATATDGSGRSAVSAVKVLSRARISPANASATIDGSVAFQEGHGFAVAWSVEGSGNGTIDVDGNYVAPGGGPARTITITATPFDLRRPAVHAFVHFLPLAQLAAPVQVKARADATLIYGVCSDSTRTNCIAIYPEKARITLSAAPPVGRFGDPNSKTRMEYVKELAAARQEQAELEQQLKMPSLTQKERAALSNKLAVLRSDNIAKLVALIQGIDFTYHAPTLEELRRKGVKPGESLTVTITATRVDDSGTHKTETQLKVVAQ